MIINVDYREKKLIELLEINKTDNISLNIANLEIGDIIISSDDNEELLIIERKSIADMASSIRDGRYIEQSMRLNAHKLHNHNIIYLLEGNINSYKSPKQVKHPILPSTIYSTICSLLYYKGFSVLKSNSLEETSELIIRISDKMAREKRKGYYTDASNNINTNTSYIDVVKSKKSANITPDNFQELILKSVPGIGPTVAKAIMDNYNSVNDMINDLHNDKNCLDSIDMSKYSAKQKKIGKKTLENILYYFKIN